MRDANGMGKVVITCAATGSIHIPTMSPHPITPDDIATPAEVRSILDPKGGDQVAF